MLHAVVTAMQTGSFFSESRMLHAVVTAMQTGLLFFCFVFLFLVSDVCCMEYNCNGNFFLTESRVLLWVTTGGPCVLSTSCEGADPRVVLVPRLRKTIQTGPQTD